MGGMRGAVSAGMRHVVVKRRLRAFPINGGRRGGAAHLLNGAEAQSSRRPLPAITGWGVVVSPVPSVLHVRHASFMRLWWQAVEAGNRAVADWGSGSVSIPCAPGGWLAERGGQPRPRPSIRRGKGDGVPHSSVIYFLLLVLLPFIRHGERESLPLDDGGEGRCSTARPSST